MSDLTASARPMATSERSAAGSEEIVLASGSRSLPMIASRGGAFLHRRPGNEAGPRSRIAGLNSDVLSDRHPLDEPGDPGG